MTTILTSPEDIEMFRVMSLRGALQLEMFGMKRSRHLPSAYSILKNEYGYKGTKKQVLDGVTKDIDTRDLPKNTKAEVSNGPNPESS